MKFKTLAVYALILLAFVGCNKDEKENEQAIIDRGLIDDYVSSNDLSGTFTESGLWYDVEEQGSGVQAYNTATVKVVYTGYLLNSSQFDASSSSGSTFGLNNVIDGWKEGIPKFREGGNGKLIIPSGLGYGNKEVGGIPKNSVLIFDIELLEVL